MKITETFGFAEISDDPLLDQIRDDLGGLLLPALIEALAYSTGLEDTVFIYQIECFIPMIVKDLEALKNGTAKDQQAYDSPECQNILNFLTKPIAPGFVSLYEAATNFDNVQTASIIYYLELEGKFNSKSGLIGQIRLFLALFG